MLPVKRFYIPGPTGQIEAIVESAGSDKGLLGIICHPHPLHGGTMNNKVVTTLVRVFERLDIVPIRFNFRGVGKSEGRHDYSLGEQDDLKAVIAWSKEQFPGYNIVLAGFSFGSFIATKVASEEQPKALITIAPPVHHNAFDKLPPIHFPWIVVQGEADEVVPPDQVFAWLAKLNPPPIVIRMPGVGHFFHGQLIELRDKLIQSLSSALV